MYCHDRKIEIKYLHMMETLRLFIDTFSRLLTITKICIIYNLLAVYLWALLNRLKPLVNTVWSGLVIPVVVHPEDAPGPDQDQG